MGLYRTQSGELVEAVAQSEGSLTESSRSGLEGHLRSLRVGQRLKIGRMSYEVLGPYSELDWLLPLSGRGGAHYSLLFPRSKGLDFALVPAKNPSRAREVGRADITVPGFSESIEEAKRPTFAKAREAIFKHLESEGWTIKLWGPSGKLKIPQAIAPYMRGPKLWFKAQAVYHSGKDDRFNDARSIHTDIRDVTPEEFLKDVERWHEG